MNKNDSENEQMDVHETFARCSGATMKRTPEEGWIVDSSNLNKIEFNVWGSSMLNQLIEQSCVFLDL